MNLRIYKETGLKVSSGMKASKGGDAGDGRPDNVRDGNKEAAQLFTKLYGYADQLGRGEFYEGQGEARLAAFEDISSQRSEGLRDTELALSRLGADDKVGSFVRRSADQQYALQKDELTTFFDKQEFGAEETELTLRQDLLSIAKQGAGNLMSQQNQAAMQMSAQEAQYGTFGSNVASGLGSAAGLIASQNYAQRFGGQQNA